MTKLKWTLAILIIFCGFFYFSNPEGIVINEKGRIEGVGNKLRALFQGRMFWDLQYTLATITLRKINEPGESFSSRMQGLDKNFKEMRDSIDEITNSYLSPNQRDFGVTESSPKSIWNTE